MTGAVLLAATSAWAHVVVTPSQASVASWLTFTVSVPNEKDLATTEVRLLVPDGIKKVTPTMKPGWSITVENDNAGHAIVWKGQLPAGFRDEFTFSTQVPDHATDVIWKAYQTYADGVVVKWEADPSSPGTHGPEATEKSNQGPYSVTRVVDDLPGSAGSGAELPLSIIAVVLSLVAAGLAVVALRRG